MTDLVVYSKWSRGLRKDTTSPSPHGPLPLLPCSPHASVQTLLFTFGPILLPRLIAYYRAIRSSAAAHNISVRPVPPGIKRALNILFVVAVLALISSIAPLQPLNVFTFTNSRLQIPTDTLFNRLTSIRPLTTKDEILKSKFTSPDARLQYLAFGPDALIYCLFCNVDEPRSFLYYAIPSILAPHLFHIGLLGLITSSLLFGPEAAVWRTQATIAGVALAALELYLRATYDVRANATATRISELDFFHWRMLSYRGIAIATVDAFLGWMLYLSSTNRAFVKPPSIDERLRHVTDVIELANRKLFALGITKTAASHDSTLRAAIQTYWDAESNRLKEVFEDKDVQDRIRAVEARLDMNAISLEAGRYADGIVGSSTSHDSGAGFVHRPHLHRP